MSISLVAVYFWPDSPEMETRDEAEDTGGDLAPRSAPGTEAPLRKGIEKAAEDVLLHVEPSTTTPSDYYRHPSRPYGVAGHTFFMLVVAASQSSRPDAYIAAINKIREATGVDEERAARLLNYMQNAVEEQSRHFRQLQAETCSIAPKVESIPQLAAELERTRQAAEERRVSLVRGASSILGEEGLRRLDMYLDRTSSRNQYVETDYERALLASGKQPEEILRDGCRNIGLD